MEQIFLLTFVIVVSVIIHVILGFLRLPKFISFIVSGLVLKNFIPFNFSDFQLIGQLGILFLLFHLGLKISISGLKTLKSFIGVSILSFVIPFIFINTFLLHYLDFKAAILSSIVLVISSTTIVSEFLSKYKILNNDFGKLAICVLICQDIISVSSLLFLEKQNYLLILCKITIFILICIISYKYINKILYQSYKKYQEIFILILFGVFLLFISLGYMIGISVEISAMAIGLILSESKFSFKIESYLTGVKDIFLAMFFINLGMSIDYCTITVYAKEIIICSIILFIIKFGGFSLSYMFYNKNRKAIIFGLLFNNMSETSLIILEDLYLHHIITHKYYDIMAIILILSLFLTPICLLICNKIFTQECNDLNKNTLKVHNVLLLGIKSYSDKLYCRLKSLGIEHVFLDDSINKVIEMRSMGASAYVGSIFNNKHHHLIKMKHLHTIIICDILNKLEIEKLIQIRDYYAHIQFIVVIDDEKYSSILIENNISFIYQNIDLTDQIIKQTVKSCTGEYITK